MLKVCCQRLVEFESLVALVATYAGGFLPPLLIAVFVLPQSIGHGFWSLCIIAVSLIAVTAATAIWVAGMAQRALVEACPGLAWMLGKAARAMRTRDTRLAPGPPLAIVMAARLPRIPRLLRPVVGLWWGTHFVGVAILGMVVYGAMEEIFKHAPLYQRLLVPLALHLALLFAANLYLLLAVAVFLRDPTTHAKVWSWRFIIDLALSFVAWGLAMYGFV
jgi:hypothetical protein